MMEIFVLHFYDKIDKCSSGNIYINVYCFSLNNWITYMFSWPKYSDLLQIKWHLKDGKLSIRVASKAAERLKIYDLRKSENNRKISKSWLEVSSTSNINILTVLITMNLFSSV